MDLTINLHCYCTLTMYQKKKKGKLIPYRKYRYMQQVVALL